MYAAMYPDGYTQPNRFVPGAIVGNCIRLILDLIGFSFGLPVLLTLYRAPTLHKALKEAPTVDDMPLACVSQFRELVFDLPFIMLGAATFLMLFRAHKLWFSMRRSPQATDRRAAAVKQFGLTIAEVVLLLLCVVTVLPTIYRLPQVYLLVRESRNPLQLEH
jgi:hypothetical protein